MPRIILVSNSIYPVFNSGGGSIILYRHLKRFEKEGYEILFINSLQKSPLNSEFEEINIKKRAWFPPLRRRFPWLMNLRITIYWLLIKDKLKISSNDIVISILGDYSNLLALKIATSNNIPLYFIYHDDSIFNAYGKLNLMNNAHIQKLARYAERTFVVSKPMEELLQQNGFKNVTLLYPLSEGNFKQKYKEWKNTFSNEITASYAGLLFEDLHVEIIGSIANAVSLANGYIEIISSIADSFKDNILKHNIQVIFRKPISPPQDLINYFQDKINLLLVFYSFKADLEHRMFTSFPSKFCEYSHLGIPILIIAPAESAIGKWAIENNWHSYLSTDNQEAMNEMVERFKIKEFWNKCSLQSLEVANTQFDPDHIHKILSNNIKAE